MGYRIHRSYATVLAFSHIVINFNFSTNTPFLLFILVYFVYLLSWLKTLALYSMMSYHVSPLVPGSLEDLSPLKQRHCEYFAGILSKIQYLEVSEVYTSYM